MQRNFIIAYLFVAFTLIYLVLVNRKLNVQKKILASENEKRMQAEAELIRHRDHLQEMVEERTRDLEAMKDEALAASRAKSDFLAKMSHELRTPLNSIIGFVTIIRDRDTGEINEVQERYLDIVHKSSRHLLDLINGILDVSKIEAGKFEIYKTGFSLHELITELADLIKPQADEKELELVCREESSIEEVFSDRMRVKQIVLNLLGNAVKFTEQGTVMLRTYDAKGRLCISIKDTGPGIDEDKHELVFESFKQGESGLARKYQGTGLGLSLSKQLAELLDGDIELISKPGEGSEFIFCIPAQ